MRVLMVGTTLLALALGAPGLRADTIVLKDGRTLSGEIQEQSKEAVRLKTTRGITVSFKMEEVKSVERGSAAAGASGGGGAGGSAALPDPVVQRFAASGTAAVDGARASTLKLLRAHEAAAAALAASPVGMARGKADTLRGRVRNLEKQLAGVNAKKEAVKTRYEGQAPGCTGSFG